MATANIYSGPEVAGTRFEGMSPMRIGALSAMSRVPGFMENIAQRRPSQSAALGAWDPREAMAVLNPKGYVRYDPTKAVEDKGFRLGSPSVSRFGGFSDGLEMQDLQRELDTLRADPERRFSEIRGLTSPNESNREKEILAQMAELEAAQQKAKMQSTPEMWYDGGNDANYQELMRDLRAISSTGQKVGQHTYFYPYKKGRTKSSVHSGYDAPFVEGDEVDALARALAGYGIKDLADIGVAQDDKGSAVFYNQVTGQALPQSLLTGYYKGKKNVTQYGLTVLPDGTVAPVYNSVYTSNSGRKSNGLGTLAKIVGMVATPFLPGAGAALGAMTGLGTVAGTALAGAGLGATTSALGGGDILKGAALGGISSGLGTYLKGADFMKNISNPAMRSAATGALSGLGSGAASAALYGGDPLKGGLTGALTGGIGGLAVRAFGNTPASGQQLSPLQQAQNAALGYAGSTVGRQLASNLIGSPYNRPATPQPQNTAPVAAPQPVVPTWLPQHVQQRILSTQGVANG